MKFTSPIFNNASRWAAITLFCVFSSASAFGGSLRVTWDPNPEPDIAGYRIYYGMSSSNYTSSVDVGNTTTAVIGSLNDGQTYFFAAKAYNTASLESVVSSEVSGTVSSTNMAPQISGLTALAAQMETTTSLSELDINDPDDPNEIMQVNLIAGRGQLAMATDVPGGVTANQVFGNNTTSLQVSAPLSAIRNTFASANGLSYIGHNNLVGADTLQVAVSDNGNNGASAPLSANAAIPITVSGDIMDDWRNQYFSVTDLSDPAKETTVYGDNADAEPDGLENLVEFALGLDPTQPGGAEEVLQLGIVQSGGGAMHATLLFRRRVNSTDLNYIPEVSSDQINWSSDIADLGEISVINIDSTFELVTYQDLTPVSLSTPRFMRLRVERTSLQ